MRLAPSAEEVHARLGDAWPISGAVDSHAHVFERGFPLAATRTFDPLPYPLEYYLAWINALGIRRCVQVNASCYGLDNSVTHYALDECRASGVAARGVATIHPEIGFVELQKLARAGFVGARLMTSRIGSLGLEAFEDVAKRCLPHRWHVEINVDHCDEWVALEPRLAKSPVPVVFEHLGRIEENVGVNAPGLRAVLRLLDKRPDFALKLSSFYRLFSKAGFSDAAPIVKLFARDFPDRLMWGSNLPHAGWSGGAPDDLELIAAALEWLPDAVARQRVFADNAERFYGL
ncbi:MAG TPA: amidohydrolase family protein [Burkholderiales bacterium]|nr:amidohydrolase family protein [Burkholderiales bacterium]